MILNFSSINCRDANIPAYWRNVYQYGIEQINVPADEQSLVLSSQGIPHYLGKFENRDFLYVPALLETRAHRELYAYAAEQKYKDIRLTTYKTYKLSIINIFFFICLLGWHYFIRENISGSINYQRIIDNGKLDGIAVILLHQYYRLATSLTLHHGLEHLANNIIWGFIFIVLLGRLCGFGVALFMTVIGGILGNGLAVLIRPLNITSLGFSTSVFASIGILAGIYSIRSQSLKEASIAILAALGMLSMIGMNGEDTDFACHITGLVAGLFLGAVQEAASIPYKKIGQFWLFTMSFVTLAMAWFFAWNVSAM